MLPMLEKIFDSKKKKSSKLFDTAIDIVSKQNDVAEKNKELDDLEYKMMLDKKDEFFISLEDFIEMMDSSDITMNTILKKCRHTSDIAGVSSVVEMHAFLEDGHIVLCSDRTNCAIHKNNPSQKLRISTIRGVR